MKTRHFILAVLALLCSATLFTACGSDDDDKGSQPTPATRSYVALWHYFTVSGDLLDYFNVDIIIDNSLDDSGHLTTGTITKRVEKNKLASTGTYEIGQISSLPGTLTVSRKVTLKDDIDYSQVSSIQLVIGHTYKYGYLDSKNNVIDNKYYNGASADKIVNATTPEKVQDLVQRVRDGQLDMTTRTFAFDKNGEWVD
jgi:hypothetical protein